MSSSALISRVAFYCSDQLSGDNDERHSRSASVDAPQAGWIDARIRSRQLPGASIFEIWSGRPPKTGNLRAKFRRRIARSGPDDHGGALASVRRVEASLNYINASTPVSSGFSFPSSILVLFMLVYQL